MELAQAEQHSGEGAHGVAEVGEETGAVGDAGCAHGEREAALGLAGFVENAGFQAEELDLGVDVEVFVVEGLGGLFDEGEGLRMVAFADCVFDCKKGEGEDEVCVGELDGLELGEEVVGCYLVVSGGC